MAEVTTLDLMRGLYEYHRWANRRLWDVAAALGEETVRREVGSHFSVPTLKGMFAHLYAADWIWLARGTGTSPPRLVGDTDFPSLAGLRESWDALEKDQQAFVEALTPSDLGRVIGYTSTEARAFRVPLWPLLQHVPNHATHHRSEIATMLTILSGSPPPTDLAIYHIAKRKSGG